MSEYVIRDGEQKWAIPHEHQMSPAVPTLVTVWENVAVDCNHSVRCRDIEAFRDLYLHPNRLFSTLDEATQALKHWGRG